MLRLITLRSNDQFNTTVYGYYDRFRGIEGHADGGVHEPRRHGPARARGGRGRVEHAESDDRFDRRVPGLRVTPTTSRWVVGGYYPEANSLLPLSHYAERSKTPAAKSIPVRMLHMPTSAGAALDARVIGPTS